MRVQSVLFDLRHALQAGDGHKAGRAWYTGETDNNSKSEGTAAGVTVLAQCSELLTLDVCS